jgi:hypothetical protein
MLTYYQCMSAMQKRMKARADAPAFVSCNWVWTQILRLIDQLVGRDHPDAPASGQA